MPTTRKKHTLFRVRAGFYNYRAYSIFASLTGGWIIRNDQGGVYARSRTLKAMRRRIDRIESAAARGAWIE